MKRLARVIMAIGCFAAAAYVWSTGTGFWPLFFGFYLASIGGAIAVLDVSTDHTEPEHVMPPAMSDEESARQKAWNETLRRLR